MVVVGNLGNKGDTLCHEPQTWPAHKNHFAICYQGQIGFKLKADHRGFK